METKVLSLSAAAKAVRKGVEDRNFSKAQDAITDEIDDQLDLLTKKKRKEEADLKSKIEETKEDFDDALVSDFNAHAGKEISSRSARCAYAKEFVKTFGALIVTDATALEDAKESIDKLDKNIAVLKELKKSITGVTVYIEK